MPQNRMLQILVPLVCHYVEIALFSMCDISNKSEMINKTLMLITSVIPTPPPPPPLST